MTRNGVVSSSTHHQPPRQKPTRVWLREHVHHTPHTKSSPGWSVANSSQASQTFYMQRCRLSGRMGVKMVEGGLPRASKAPTPGLAGSLVSNRRSLTLWGRVALLYTLEETGAHHTPSLLSPRALTGLHNQGVGLNRENVAGPGVRLGCGRESPSEPAYTLPPRLPRTQAQKQPFGWPAVEAALKDSERQARLLSQSGEIEIIVWKQAVACVVAFPSRTQPGMHVHTYVRTSLYHTESFGELGDYFLTTSTALWAADYETLGRAARKTDKQT